MKKFSEYIEESFTKEVNDEVKLFNIPKKDKYWMLENAEGIVVKVGKTKSTIKITNLDNTDLYRPKTEGISVDKMKANADKSFMNKEFSFNNKYIISKK